MAVVRVKRRLQDNPIEAIFLKCKKLKLEEGSCTAVFKFAATVKKDDDVAEHIKEAVASSTQHENKPPGPTKNITEKMRARHSQNSKNNRFKVVNYFRALESQKVKSEDGSAPVGKTLTVVDMEKCSTVGAGETTAELTTREEGKSGAEQYVYDLYYTYNPDLDDALIERLMSGHGSISDSAFGESETLDEDDDDSLPFDDEDDSNDENNWRNDYPDEDDFSPDEDDMRLAMRLNKIALDGSDAESSEDEYRIYDDDLELDPSVVRFHGSAYARFKAEFKRKYSSDES